METQFNDHVSVKIIVPEEEEPPPKLRRRTETEGAKKLPKFLKHYAIFSYVIFGLCAVRSTDIKHIKHLLTFHYFIIVQFLEIGYLCYAATILFNPELFIQYEPVNELLAYNSYNLQCPFIGLLCKLFTFHTDNCVS